MIIKETEDNVHIIDMVYEKGWEQWFFLSSDWHLDHPDCDIKLLTSHLDKALERNAWCFVFGDLVCGMQSKGDKRGSKSSIKSEHNQDNYIDLLVNTTSKFLSKYSSIFKLYTYGNHETSIIKHKETDVVDRIVEKINEKQKEISCFTGGYSGYVRFRFRHRSGGNGFSVTLKYRHSGGSLGEITQGFLGVNKMAVTYVDADIMVSGDNHTRWSTSIMQEKLNDNGKIIYKEVRHIKLPTYKEEYKKGKGGFHVESNRPPKPLGGAWLRFYYENREIKFDIIDAR